jgi:hypothetical protein
MRSDRRAARRCAVAKAARIYPDLPAVDQKQLADNRKSCSCWMCGNPRHHSKGPERITMQERRAALQLNDHWEH